MLMSMSMSPLPLRLNERVVIENHAMHLILGGDSHIRLSADQWLNTLHKAFGKTIRPRSETCRT